MGTFVKNAIEQAVDTWGAIKNPPYSKIDAQLARAENLLNKAGWIPGVSILTGQAREYLGYSQILMAATIGAFHEIAATFTKDEKAKQKLYKQVEVDLSYAMNGLGNIVRGNIEKLAAWNLWAVAINKLVLFSYDALGFRFNYGHEKISERDIPLLRSFERQKV